MTTEDTRRNALLVVQRRYMRRNATDEHEIYDSSAQYLTPALVLYVFGHEVQHTYCLNCYVSLELDEEGGGGLYTPLESKQMFVFDENESQCQLRRQLV